SKIPLGRWFKNWTIQHELCEIPFKGNRYTWSNNREGTDLIHERLDRAYGNNEWINQYPNSIVWNFPIFISDHGPMALDTQPTTKKKKRPYRLEAWCFDKPEITHIIEESGKVEAQGSKMFTLQRRLEVIKTECMKWCLDHKKERLLRERIEKEIKDKWAYWQQRAKSKWDDWRDKSTGFFFRSVKTRGVKNEIRAIKDDNDQWIMEESSIKKAFQEYFCDLL
ncbi:Nitrilase, partial [Bienertia sinuspersici]